MQTPSRKLMDRNHSLTDIGKSARMKDFLSARLAPAYKSAKSSFIRKFSYRSNGNIHNDPEDLPLEVTEIDAGESPPADESLFFDNLEASKHVKINNKNIKSALCSMVDIAELKLLINMEKGKLERCTDGNLFPKSSERFKNIAYIWACFRGLVDLLPIFEQSGFDVHYVEPTSGVNAIFASSLADSASCVEYLLTRGADVNTVNSVNNYTPLHFAAFGNACNTATLLLNHGAKLNANFANVDPILHCAIRARSNEMVKLLLERGASVTQKNHLGETPLHVACFVQSKTCVELLRNVTEIDVNAVDRDQRTPLHFAVMSTDCSADLIEILLKRGAAVNPSDKNGFTPLHIAALNELSQCVDTLIWAGADLSATTGAGISAFSIILRKVPESLEVFRQRLDASIQLIRPVSHNREYEMRLHFDLLFPSNNKCETIVINTLLQEPEKSLLSHPLIIAFLHLKWEKIRKFYHVRILVYLVTVIVMTAYVLAALAYKCDNSIDPSNNDRKVCGDSHFASFFFKKHVIEFEWYLLVFLTCVTIPRKIFGYMVYKSWKQYLSNRENILDIIVLSSVFSVFFMYTGMTYDWQTYVGAFVILCAWTNLMLLVGQLPAFGTYVAMFTHIQWEFAKLFLAYSSLLIGFTISFCVIFPGEPAFGNPFTGLIKVLVMMAGELDFGGLIEAYSYETMAVMSICSQILFAVFLVFVTVILMNLLVGIAVHDIQGLRKQAGLTKLVRQTNLILFIEMALHKGVMPQLFRKWMFHFGIYSQNVKAVLVVKPLNPLEKRLPKEVLQAAYVIAQRNMSSMLEERKSLSEHMTLLKQQSSKSEVAELQSSIERLSTRLEDNEDGIRSMREQLGRTNQILEHILMELRENIN